MKTALITIAAVGALALSVVSNPNDAQAQCRGCGFGLGIVGGLVAGTIIGGAIARSAYPAYAVVPGYEPYVGYAAPVPVGCPGGFWARQPLLDQWGRVVSYSPPRFFCP